MFDSTIEDSVVIGDYRLEPMTNLGPEMNTGSSHSSRVFIWESTATGNLFVFSCLITWPLAAFVKDSTPEV